jgi:pimeloyl-ACP methyl ester carboxylesterase
MLMVKKIMKWVVAGLIGLIIVGLAGGRLYQVLAEENDREQYPPPGQLIDVDGHLMHIHCQGEGSPTVVVEQGLGSVSSSWIDIHSAIATTTRICAYDRVGMGYSEPIGHPVRAIDVADMLHKLLQGADITDDLVMVGWSAGGVYIREFYRQGPEKVKAMLFVDSSHEQQGLRMPERPGNGDDLLMETARYLAPFGLVRMSGAVASRFEGFTGPDRQKSTLISLYEQSHSIEALLNESETFTLDIRDDEPPTSLGNLPLTVLTAGKEVKLTEEMPADFTLEYLQKVQLVWNKMQVELTALSTRGKQIVAKESGHGIHADQPDLLIDSVNELVLIVRQAQ